MAIASLVLGILWLGVVGSILALVFGYAAKKEIKRNPNRLTGGGMATAGIVLGWIGLVIPILIVLVILLVLGIAGLQSVR